MQKLKKGFTLIELLVVIAIIAILATVVIINVTGAKAKAARAKVAADMNVAIKVASACRTFDGTFVPYAIASQIAGGSICTITTVDQTEIDASTGNWPTSIAANGFTDATSTPITAAGKNVSIIVKATNPNTATLTCTLSGCVPNDTW